MHYENMYLVDVEVGYEDHGCFGFCAGFKSGSGAQSFGWFCNINIESLQAIVKMFGSLHTDKCKSNQNHVFRIARWKDEFDRIEAVGSPVDDMWFYFDLSAKRFKLGSQSAMESVVVKRRSQE